MLKLTILAKLIRALPYQLSIEFGHCLGWALQAKPRFGLQQVQKLADAEVMLQFNAFFRGNFSSVVLAKQLPDPLGAACVKPQTEHSSGSVN
jgi:hypothetical protein